MRGVGGRIAKTQNKSIDKKDIFQSIEKKSLSSQQNIIWLKIERHFFLRFYLRRHNRPYDTGGGGGGGGARGLSIIVHRDIIIAK